ncbi:hypothetical protein UFOVP355_43 [uncultured Caudovirales phage]|uniref:Uncharacterized protein n=1 Tax=uncultured Caudovirales phage TaxID=2100421 RepID=A0A6J5LZP9_9CAUD|nr:hypothetical protein UFOVP355_43 [uncultured Caudovirales phage]CAB4156932.1 hypothetical protein UFOVP677_43 [uncultured Caudovirales phage]
MYGKIGKAYDINGTEFNVDDKFVLSTLMAIIVSIREMNPDYPSVDSAIEKLAESIYEQIKEVEPSDTERTTDEPAS